MRARTTILLLLLLAGTAFVAGLDAVRRTEAQKFDRATAALESTWRKSADQFWQNQGRQLDTLVKDLPLEHDMLGAILDNKTDMAKARWDTRMLSSYGAHAIWAFRRDGTLFYSHAATEAGDLEKAPVP